MNIKNDIILELNGCEMNIFDDAIKFNKNGESLFIYNRIDNELLMRLYPIGITLMNKYGLSESEFSEEIKNILKIDLWKNN